MDLKDFEEQIKMMQDPDYNLKKVLAIVVEKIKVAKGDKGDPGYTPVKGVDYFTQKEADALIQYFKDTIKNGVDGRPGKDGFNPIKGVDYYTDEEKEELIEEAISRIPVPKDGVSPKVEDIVKLVNKAVNNNPKQEFVTIKQLTDFLARGGFRGGGGSSSGQPTLRVLALTNNSATPTFNTNSYDVIHITNQTAAITSMTTGVTGGGRDGQWLRVSITGTGAVGITWGTLWENGAATLPGTTVGTTRLDILAYWNTETSKWRCMAQG